MSYKNSEFIEWINENIHSERDRLILYERFVNGLTFSELSDKFYLSERQIKRIVKKADVFLVVLDL
jgi:DNA-directed RNA polymerase specialized sigma subunit